MILELHVLESYIFNLLCNGVDLWMYILNYSALLMLNPGCVLQVVCLAKADPSGYILQ